MSTIMHAHAATVALLGRDRLTSYLVRDYFDLPRTNALMAALLDRGLCQADLVLCVLHLHDHAPSADLRRVLRYYIRRLVGRPILVGEPCLLRYKTNGHPPRTSRPLPGDRRIVWVTPNNPRQPGTTAATRWSEFRAGRTVSQLRVRGVTRRDVRAALRHGWIRLEEAHA